METSPFRCVDAMNLPGLPFREGIEVLERVFALWKKEQYLDAETLLLDKISESPASIIAACRNLLRSMEDGDPRRFLASQIVYIRERFPKSEISVDDLELATSVIAEALRSSDEDVYFYTGLIYVALTDIPAQVLRMFKEKLVSDSLRARILAASVLTVQVAGLDVAGVHGSDIAKQIDLIVSDGLSSDDGLLRCMASAVAIMRGKRYDEARCNLLECLAGAKNGIAESFAIIGIYYFPEKDPELVDAFFRVFTDLKRPIATRAMAARALSQIVRLEDAELIGNLLATQDKHIACEVIRVFARRSELRNALMGHLLGALEHHEPVVRGAALNALSVLPDEDGSISRALIARIGVERDMRVFYELAEALATRGEPIVEGLLQLVRSWDVAVITLASSTFVRMGPLGVRKVVERLRTSSEEIDRFLFCAMIREMSQDAHSCVPELVKALEEISTPDPAVFLIEALCALGAASLPALPTLLIRLSNAKEPNEREWIERAIRSMGSGALPLLTRALQGATPDLAPVLERCVRHFPTESLPRYRRLSELGQDDLLTYYYAAVLIQRDPSITEAKIAAQLRVQRKLRRIPLRNTIERASVNKAFKRVASALEDGNRLRLRKGRASSRMTTSGMRAWFVVAEYIRSIGIGLVDLY